LFLELKAQATSILKDAIQKAGLEIEDSELYFETSSYADLASRPLSDWQVCTGKTRKN